MTQPRAPFDPSFEEMRRIGYAAIDRIVDDLQGLSEARVARRGTGAELIGRVDGPLPTAGLGPDDSLRVLFERVVPGMTRVHHPRFHAYIPCPSSYFGMVGEILAAGLNPFVGSWLGGSTVAALELVVLRWIAELVGYPPNAAGILTSGGSMANFAALAAARARAQARGRHERPDVQRIYISHEGHGSMAKAARILGYGESCLRSVPVDSKMRMDVGALEMFLRQDRDAGLHPLFVCANAGTTNTGSVDPLERVAESCAAADAWFHVDGAYGGFAAITSEGRRRLAGMERADSLTLDPHKWLYCPMGVGCVLVRNAAELTEAFRAHGDYLKDLPADEVNFLDRGPELSRPARAFSVWMVIRSAGREGLAAQIEEDMRLARVAAELLAQDPRFEIVLAPELSVVTFRHRLRDAESENDREARDARLMEATLASGELMLSTTTIAGRSAIRLVVMNHRTSEAELRRTVRVIRELAS